MNGLEVAGSICSGDIKSEIVFTTAHQQYAYDALGLEPLDFLIKPYCLEDIGIVLMKYRSKISKRKLEEKLEKLAQSQSALPRLKLPSNHGFVMVDAKDIVLIKSDVNKTILHLNDGTKEKINKNLYSVFKLLNSSIFYRLNRSCVINLNYILRLDKRNGKCVLSYNNILYEESITNDQFLSLESFDFIHLSFSK